MLNEVASVATADDGALPPSAPSRVTTTGIAILGSHPATVERAPFGDPAWRIYACSPHNVEHRTLPRVDKWFEVHDPVEDPTRPFVYLKAISEMPVVLMRDQRAIASRAFKGAVAYPDVELYGTNTKLPDGNIIPNGNGEFNPWMFTSSIAYMMAYAIKDCEREGIKHMSLWGIMQASDTEYRYQRPGIQYFIDQAMRRGIKVIAPRESRLFDLPREKW
jgi:hypothetical protein